MGEAKRRGGAGGPGDLRPMDVHVRDLARAFASGTRSALPRSGEPELDDALERQANHLRATLGPYHHAAFLNRLRTLATRRIVATSGDRGDDLFCSLFVIPVHGEAKGLATMMRDDVLRRLEATLEGSGVIAPGSCAHLSAVSVSDVELADAQPARLDAVTEVAALFATDPEGRGDVEFDRAVAEAIRFTSVPGTRPQPRVPSDREIGFVGIVGVHVAATQAEAGFGDMNLLSHDGRFTSPLVPGRDSLERTWRDVLREHRCVADAPCTFPEAAAMLGFRMLTTSALLLKKLVGLSPRDAVERVHVRWGKEDVTCVLEHEGAFLGPVVVPARLWMGNDPIMRRALSATGVEVTEHAPGTALPVATIDLSRGNSWTH